MEYGEAITDSAAERALAIARRLRTESDRPDSQIAREAIALAYCVCVTDGEDAAEQQFSQVHRDLIDDLVTKLQAEHRPSKEES